jgi:hypothetical protein
VKTLKDVDRFEKVEQQLHAMLADVSELSRKKANDGLNEFKLKFVNALLDNLNDLLNEHKPFEDFKKFDENDLPTNSDVVVILSQYAAAMLLFREKNTRVEGGYWHWVVDGNKLARTESPVHFKYRG